MHFRNSRKPRTDFNFSYGRVTLDVVDSYKYCGIYFGEFINFKPAVERLADSAC